jgi:hypothetical protein
MSWDLFVMDIPESVKTLAELDRLVDFKPGPIGSRAAIASTVTSLFPGADFSGPGWGTIQRPAYSIEVNMAGADSLIDDTPRPPEFSEQVIDFFALHVRGGHEAAYAVARLLKHMGLRALTTTESGIFDPDNPIEGLAGWSDYRDQVLKDIDAPLD